MFCFGRKWNVPIYSTWKTLAHLSKKIIFPDIDRKNWQSTSTRKHDRSRSKKEGSQDDADRTFPNWYNANFVHGLNWKLNCRHRSWNSPDWYFSATLSNLLFGPKLACSHLFGQENISPSRKKKILFTDIDRNKWQSTSARKHDRSRSKIEASQDDADRTFPNWYHANFVHGLNWKLNNRHRSWNSPDWFFQQTLSNFFEKLSLADNGFFLR